MRWPLQRVKERLPLGTHSGAAVSGLVELRALRLGGTHARLEVGRSRPRRLELRRGTGVEVVDVPRSRDPWPDALLAVLVLWVVSATFLALTRAYRRQVGGTS